MAASAVSESSTSPNALCSSSNTEGIRLIEIAPGSELERDILAQIAFKPRIAENLSTMDKALFQA